MIVGYLLEQQIFNFFGINQLVTKDYVGWVDASKNCNGCNEEVYGQRYWY